MRAVTFAGIRSVAVVDRPPPEVVDPHDAVVEVELAAICGSDLHPYEGRERGLDVGATMGHELTGRVVAVGDAVTGVAPGDAVMSPFSTSCGACATCRRGLSSRCPRGALLGWVEGGRGLQGAQAGRVRVPLADGTLVLRPPDISAVEALLLGDVVATGFFATERAGVGPGDRVAVVGLGAVGLAAVLAARQAGASEVLAFDAVASRLELAASFGATPVAVRDDAARARPTAELAAIARRGAGEGVASVVEAVGSPESTRLAIALLRPGGHLSIASVHTEGAFAVTPTLAYDHNLTLSMGRCPARSRLDALTELVRAVRPPLERIVTHRVPIDDAADAYRMFAERRDGCIKVALEV